MPPRRAAARQQALARLVREDILHFVHILWISGIYLFKVFWKVFSSVNCSMGSHFQFGYSGTLKSQVFCSRSEPIHFAVPETLLSKVITQGLFAQPEDVRPAWMKGRSEADARWFRVVWGSLGSGVDLVYGYWLPLRSDLGHRPICGNAHKNADQASWNAY